MCVNPICGLYAFYRQVKLHVNFGQIQNKIMIIPSALFYAIFAWEFKILHAQVTVLKRLGIEDVKDKESCLYFRYALYLSTFLEVIPSLIG